MVSRNKLFLRGFPKGLQVVIPSPFLFSPISFFFWPCCAAYGILAPQPGIEPRPLAVKAESPNPATARDVPSHSCLSSQELRSFGSRPDSSLPRLPLWVKNGCDRARAGTGAQPPPQSLEQWSPTFWAPGTSFVEDMVSG